MRARRSFVIPAAIFSIVFYLALPASVGLFREAMSRPAIGPLTYAYVFALVQFAVAGILLAIYMRVAKTFDKMTAEIVARASAEAPE